MKLTVVVMFTFSIIIKSPCASTTPCEEIISFYRATGIYKVQDCTLVTPRTIMWKIETPVTWSSAAFACRAVGAATNYHGDLASIHNFDEFQAAINLHLVKPHTPASYTWIGLTGASGSWKWSDGTALDYNKIWPAYKDKPTSSSWRGCLCHYRKASDTYGFTESYSIAGNAFTHNYGAICKTTLAS